jgi:hypothetical protein
MHAPLYLSKGMAREFAQVIYFLTARFPVFRRERAKPTVEIFRKLLESEDKAVLMAAYSMFTSLKLQAVATTEDVVKHIALAEVRPAVLRWLTVADMGRLEPSLVAKVAARREKKLVAAVLWRAARLEEFGRAVITAAESWMQFETRDALKLVLVLLEHQENRKAVAEISQLPGLLRAAVDLGPEVIPALAVLVRRLPLTPVIVRRFEESGFIRAFITSAIAAGEFRPVCLFVDAVLHAGFVQSTLDVAAVIVDGIRKNAAAQKYGLAVLVALSFFPEAHEKLAQVGVEDLLRAVPACAENTALVEKFRKNITIA